MPELRWILLLVGLALVAGVWWWGRKEQARRARQAPARAEHFDPQISDEELLPRRLEPTLEGGSTDSMGVQLDERQSATADDAAGSERDEATGAEPQLVTEQAAEKGKIVVLRVAAPDGERLDAVTVIEALTDEDLEHGQYKIFHRWGSPGHHKPVFSVASMVEPGSFDLDQLDGMTVPGLTLFAILPGPLKGIEAFDTMLDTARRLAARLGWSVQDESGNALTAQRIGFIRDEIVEFQVHHGTTRPGMR